MFNCLDDDCLEDDYNASLKRTGNPVAETYPSVCYPVTAVNYSGTMMFYGVYELESEAQQYILDHQTESKPLTYYIANFIPPSKTTSNSNLGSGPNYPNLVYVMTSKRPDDPHYIPQPPSVFANENDASDFVLTKSNKDINFMYSIQNWIAANTYSYQRHGFVGLRFFAPVYAPVAYAHPSMQRK